MHAGTRWIAVALLAGCVGKGRHELVEVQLEATRAALSARQAACQEASTALEADLREANAALDVARRELRESADASARLEDELAALRAEQARWIVAAAPDAGAPAPDELGALLTKASEAGRARARAAAAHEAVVAAFAKLVEAGRVEVVAGPDGSVVRLAVAVLFQEGKVLLSPLGEAVLADVAAALAPLGGRALRIEGHTDDRPHHSVEQPSNWELGFDRAVLVLRALQDHGLAAPVTVASRADTAPIVAPGADARNARVEIVIAP